MLPPDKLPAAKAEFDSMETKGIFDGHPVHEHLSPLHLVPKASGGWHPCGKDSSFNNVIVPDRYPVPHIQDFSNHVAGKAIFSKINQV